MSINYGLKKTFSLLLDSLHYNVMISIIISSIILLIICLLNKRISKYIILSINVILLILILKYYIVDILKFDFINPINNIDFYFFNSIIFIIIISLKSIFNRLNKCDYIFNSIFLIFIGFSLFMTHYLHNLSYIIIFNIYPMIKLGNILMIIYYLVLLTKVFYSVIIKTTSKRSE